METEITYLDALIEIAGESNVYTEDRAVDKLSKDYYWYSPVLKRQLEDKKADVAVKISDLQTLKQVITLCCEVKVPVILRGGGTGNYGQLIPLYGGVLIDLTGFNEIYSFDGGVVHCAPGARLQTIENEGRKHGWELRCMPSTWVKSSIGGFLAGGSGGIGSITYGGLNYGDNIKSVTILTIEAEPRLMKFEERDCIKAIHTYGTNGILVDIEMRMGPKKAYNQHIFYHEDWDTLLDWTDKIARDTSIPKRLVTQFETSVSDFFKPLKKYLPQNTNVTFLMVESSFSDGVLEDAEKSGMMHAHTFPHKEPIGPPLVTDYTWNHTTLWALKSEPTITYLQCGYGDNFREQINLLREECPDGELLQHLEWVLSNSKMQNASEEVAVGGLPLVRFKSEERLQYIIDYCASINVFVANPHTDKVEEGGAHPDIEEKRALKAEVDPLGILNPGKLCTYPHNPFA